MSRLQTELQAIPSGRVLLKTSAGSFSTGELLELAHGIRRQFPQAEGKRIGIRCRRASDLILGLLALDGFCESLLLLPASLEEPVCADLASRTGSAWLYADRYLQPAPFDDAPAATELPAASRDGDTQWLLATSGTTGTPKIIIHTLSSLCRTVKHNHVRGAEFVWGLIYDPCRFAGLQVVLQSLLGGSCLVVPDAAGFDAEIDALVTGQINALSATPSQWRKMLMDRRILACPLKQITLGGEIADQTLLNSLQRAFPTARIVHIYASTEAGVGFAVTDGLAGFPAAWLDAGYAGIELRIGESHCLQLKSQIMAGGEEIASRLDPDGFLDSGDLVRLEGGRVLFLGRASGAINVGGNKVHPEDVEAVLRQVEGVNEVRVLGRKNSIIGELVVAEVVAGAAIEWGGLRKRILEHCREHLPSYKVPTMLRCVDALPTTSAGKMRRRRDES